MRRILILVGAAWFCLAGLAAQAAHTQARLVLAAATARPGRHGPRGRAASHGPALAHLLAEPGRLGHGDQDRVATARRHHRRRHPVAGPGEAPGRRSHHLHLYRTKSSCSCRSSSRPICAPGRSTSKPRSPGWSATCNAFPARPGVQATLNVGTETKPSKDAALLQAWQTKLPKSGSGSPRAPGGIKPPPASSRSLILEWNSPAPAGEADFFPDASEDFEVQPATETSSSRRRQNPAAQGGQEIRRRLADAQSPAC